MYLRCYATLVLEGPSRENLTTQNERTTTAMKFMEDSMTFWTWEWILQEIVKI